MWEWCQLLEMDQAQLPSSNQGLGGEREEMLFTYRERDAEMHAYPHTSILTHTHTHTHTYTHIDTHIHTHTNKLMYTHEQ